MVEDYVWFWFGVVVEGWVEVVVDDWVVAEIVAEGVVEGWFRVVEGCVRVEVVEVVFGVEAKVVVEVEIDVAAQREVG